MTEQEIHDQHAARYRDIEKLCDAFGRLIVSFGCGPEGEVGANTALRRMVEASFWAKSTADLCAATKIQALAQESRIVKPGGSLTDEAQR